jgi:hypothetical protein
MADTPNLTVTLLGAGQEVMLSIATSVFAQSRPSVPEIPGMNLDTIWSISEHFRAFQSISLLLSILRKFCKHWGMLGNSTRLPTGRLRKQKRN